MLLQCYVTQIWFQCHINVTNKKYNLVCKTFKIFRYLDETYFKEINYNCKTTHMYDVATHEVSTKYCAEIQTMPTIFYAKFKRGLFRQAEKYVLCLKKLYYDRNCSGMTCQ